MPARRLVTIAGVLASLGLAGCLSIFPRAEQVRLPDDPAFGLPGSDQACAPPASAVPPGPPGPLSTVVNPEANQRPISLAECIALALENGRTGENYDRPGTDRHTSVLGITRDTTLASDSDSIRVFAYEPAVLATEIEESLAKFDAFWSTSAVWNRIDREGVDIQSVPALFGVLNNRERVDDVEVRTGLYKPLPTGGIAGITFQTDYEKANLPPGVQIVNPAYRPSIDLTFEQPLWQGAGVLINQLRETFPNGVRTPVPVGGRVPGILLARIAHEQVRAEFERHVQDLLYVVEEAYWELYCAYWDLYSRENGVRQTYAAWQIAKARFDAGGIPIEDLAEIEEQFHAFRSQRLEALGRGTSRPGVLEAERRLRYVVGLPPEDGTRLIPSDAPMTSPLEPDWVSAYNDAMARRPEFIQIHQEIQAARMAALRARDIGKPDARFISSYNVNGLGGDLGPSLSALGESSFHDWELGLQATVPIGSREGNAEVARARLRLAQRVAFLRDEEEKVVLSLARSQRELVQFREEMGVRRSQEHAARVQVQARFEKFQAGKESADLLVRAQRQWVDALRDTQIAVCRYNIALADFERQKGTILEYCNVRVLDGVLPACAQARASAHIRELNRAPTLREPSPDNPLDRKAPGVADAALPCPANDEPLELPQLFHGPKPPPDKLE